ncbi:MAG: GNAT family N-acetyltransferase [Candidatus Nealsonbacteria bacterium]|nr:GNAT family N-acetyltransferase [Candidatus Nealsonbacteria bacterium]
MITIRAEKPEDYDAIYEINKRAFNSEFEARLIDTIRHSNNFISDLSLVALKDNSIVGHILFSQANIKSREKERPILILAPIAVLPEFQKQGIGSLLVKKGLHKSQTLGYDIVALIGYPGFFSRFGFSPARSKELELSLKGDIPGESFMVYELKKGVLSDVEGIVDFPLYFEEE